jgi:hypothetical protein
VIAGASHPEALWSALWPLVETRASDAALLTSVFAFAAWSFESGTRLVKVCALDGFYRRLSDSKPLQAAIAKHQSLVDRVAPEAVAALEAEIEQQILPWREPCPICDVLAAPLLARRHDGESLPASVRQLCRPFDLTRSAFDIEELLSSRRWVLRCPACGRFYDFVYEYDYVPAGGTTETESIAPMDPQEARGWSRAFVLDDFPPGQRSE